MKRYIKKILHVILRLSPGNKIRVKILKMLGANIKGELYIAQNFFVLDAGKTEYLTIEKNVGIGPNVTILIHSDPYPSNLSSLYPRSWKKIHIGENVWIGACSTILGGVTIGNNSIVAAGSVVTKDVPPFTMVAGVPAKSVKNLRQIIELNNE